MTTFSPFVTRFAPSPTGYLHAGHGFAALQAWQAAQEAEGSFLLRIENIDTTRCRLPFERAIYEDLTWLGIEWPHPVRRQDEHFDEYQQALADLAKHHLIYKCFRTRKEISDAVLTAPHDFGPDGPVFTGSALPASEEQARIDAKHPYAWRLSMAKCQEYLGDKWDNLFFTEEGIGPDGQQGQIKATPAIFGDVIVARKDIGASYHLSVTHDDALQQVTHILRGQDLFFATHVHCLLQALMGWPTPIYRHHKLIEDMSGLRLAKRRNSPSLKDMRENGMSREAFLTSLDVNLMR